MPAAVPAPALALRARWVAAGLDPTGLDASLSCQVDRRGQHHLDPHCAAGRRHERWASMELDLEALADVEVCRVCANADALAATLEVAGTPAASWLRQAAQLEARMAQLDATDDPALVALAVPRLIRDAAWLARTPQLAGTLATAASLAAADALVRRELTLDRAALERWARRAQLRRTYLYAPIPSGVRAGALGGFDAVEEGFTRWSLSHPSAPAPRGWEAVHAHWDAVAAQLPLGALELCAVTPASGTTFDLDELGTFVADPPALRARRRVLLEWVCPRPTVRLLPRAVVDLLAVLAAAESWTLHRVRADDPLAIPLAQDRLRAGLPVPQALRVAAGSMLSASPS